MTNLTPEIIESATDEQLAELVAVHCLGYVHGENGLGDKCYRRGKDWIYDWQPHLENLKGKGQCWVLAEKFKLIVDFESNTVHGDDYYYGQSSNPITDESLQKAVMKACLYSVMGDM